VRWLTIPLLLTALALSEPAAAAAPVTLGYAVSTHTLRFAGQASTVSITLHTGPSAETASLGLDPSSWQDRHVFGSPLRTNDQQVTGAGKITGSFASSCCDFPAGASICQRGPPPPSASGIDLALPADNTTTVSYRVRLAAPPWPPAPVYLGIVVGVPAIAQSSSDVSFYHLGPVQFDVRGPSGVHIRLAAAGGRHPRRALYPVVAIGGKVDIVGTTEPKITRARLEIAAVSTTSSHRRMIGNVTTDHTGAFRIDWKPRARGTYTITAAYRHPAPGRLADRSCDLAISVP
jgi:hypothetical protein